MPRRRNYEHQLQLDQSDDSDQRQRRQQHQEWEPWSWLRKPELQLDLSLTDVCTDVVKLPKIVFVVDHSKHGNVRKSVPDELQSSRDSRNQLSEVPELHGEV